MKFETGEMSDVEIKSYKALAEEVHFQSSFNFLKNISGFRPGEMHMILAPSGGGKSTLMRSIMLDLQQNSPEVLLWLTEESSHQFKTAMAYTDTTIKNLRIISETDNGYPRNNLNPMYQALIKFKPDIFILDNLTANMTYEMMGPKQQTGYALELKKMAHDANIPFLIFAHTNMAESDLRNREIGLNDVRGGKGVAMLFEFVMTLQNFLLDAGYDPVKNAQTLKRVNKLAIIKNRSQIAEYDYFNLRFNRKTRTYVDDMSLSKGQFKAIWKSRVI
jgi:energy-coupling factor transporter ATP-binding protein EcfA2